MFEGLTFKVADAPEQLRALELRRRVYEAEFGHHGVDAFDTRAHQLIAVNRTAQIVAAFRVLGPDRRPFEIEQFVNLSDFVSPGRSPAQIGGLWVLGDHPSVRRNPLIPLAMLKLAYLFARRHQITDYVMKSSVLQLREFYQRAFFTPLDHLTFEHPSWGRVYVMHLNLVALEARHRESPNPITRFLFGAETSNIQV